MKKIISTLLLMYALSLSVVSFFTIAFSLRWLFPLIKGKLDSMRGIHSPDAMQYFETTKATAVHQSWSLLIMLPALAYVIARALNPEVIESRAGVITAWTCVAYYLVHGAFILLFYILLG